MTSRKLILTFHGIGEPQGSIPSEERDVWVPSETFLAILDACAEAMEEGVDIEVMFDDGNLSDLETALPALRQRDLRGAFFIVAGRLGAKGYLNTAHLRNLRQEGMLVGCHGMRHVPWTCLPDTQFHEEIVDARDVIEEAIGEKISLAACPFGAYSRRVIRGLKQAGYKRIYTSDRGWSRPNAWIQARNTIHRYNGVHDVTQWLELSSHVIEQTLMSARRALKRWS